MVDKFYRMNLKFPFAFFKIGMTYPFKHSKTISILSHKMYKDFIYSSLF